MRELLDFGTTIKAPGGLEAKIHSVALLNPFWEYYKHKQIRAFMHLKRALNLWNDDSIDQDFSFEQKQKKEKVPQHGFHYVWDDKNSYQRRFVPIRTMVSW